MVPFPHYPYRNCVVSQLRNHRKRSFERRFNIVQSLGNSRYQTRQVVSQLKKNIPSCGKANAQLASYETQDSLNDLAWSEVHENQLVTVSGDGSIKLWDVALNVSTHTSLPSLERR